MCAILKQDKHLWSIKMKEFIKKLDNFWYHYKWHTIFIAFFVVLFTICTVQCAMKDDPDAMILYSGPEVMSAEGKTVLGSALATRLDGDPNGDGSKIVSLTDIVILSDEQIKEKENEAKEEGSVLYYDPTQRAGAIDQVKKWLLSGQMMIAILDPFVYQQLSMVESANLFVPLTEIFGTLPESAYNEYAISMDKLDLVEYNADLKTAFSGTVICLVRPTVVSTFDTSWYERHLDFFRRIVTYEVIS